MSWYEGSARALPWRAAAGSADPYAVLVSEIMLQQTTVAAVTPRFLTFLDQFPSFAALAAAEESAVVEAWAGLGYYSRARRLHALARIVAEDHGGVLPDDAAALRALPGLGSYTAASVGAIVFGHEAPVVDTNVARWVRRVFGLFDVSAAAKLVRERTAELGAGADPASFAQASMELGALICTARNPRCADCPIAQHCVARAEDRYELAAPTKKPRTIRKGTVYVARVPGGALLTERRPGNALFGGSLGLPGRDWEDREGTLCPPAGAVTLGRYVHNLTHIELRIEAVSFKLQSLPPGYTATDDPDPARFPTFFRKALDLENGLPLL